MANCKPGPITANLLNNLIWDVTTAGAYAAFQSPDAGVLCVPDGVRVMNIADQYSSPIGASNVASLAPRPRLLPPRRGFRAAVLAEFFSIEASFVFFLGSGTYKNFPALQGFPVDLTILTLVVTACLIIWALVSGRIRSVSLGLPVLLIFLFSEFAAASLFWSSLDSFNINKALHFLLLTSPCFFAAHALAQDPERRRRLARMLAWLSITILLYYAYRRYVAGDTLTEGNNQLDHLDPRAYQEYGNYASILFTICLVLVVFGSRRQVCAAVFGLGVTLYALLVIGGRGALATALLSVPLLALGLLWDSARRRRLSRLLALLSGIIAITAVGYVYVGGSQVALDQQFSTLDRYQAQLSNEDTASMDERHQGRILAWNLWLQKPILGWGIGEYGIKDSYLMWPHNLLLEILMEMGIVGAYLFFAVSAIAVRNCARIARDPECDWADAAIALLFLTDLALHVTVAGYLGGDRHFLAFIGLVTGARAAAGRSISTAAPFLSRS